MLKITPNYNHFVAYYLCSLLVASV